MDETQNPEISMKMRKQFVKEFKLPIPVLEWPMFEYFLSLYEADFKAFTHYKEYVNVWTEVGLDSFLDKRQAFIDEAIAHVTKKMSFYDFNTCDLSAYQERFQSKSLHRKLLTPQNAGKQWISVDMKKANFYAMKQFDNLLVDEKDTYEEWVSQFDNHEVFGHSKHVRQVIFGNLNPKRQQSIQAYYMHLLLKQVVDVLGEDTEVIVVGNDEIVLPDTEEVRNVLLPLVLKMEEETSFVLTTSSFFLDVLDSVGYVKLFADGKCELVGVNKNIYAQVYKNLNSLPLVEEDFMFTHEGKVAQYVKGY